MNYDDIVLSNSAKDRFSLVIQVLDSPLQTLFSEMFKRTRNYELGLEFYDICQYEIGIHKNEIDPYSYERYQRYLICLKLCMLDYLNLWEEYLSFTHEILKTTKIENKLNFSIQRVNERYLYLDSSNITRIHFLCSCENRYSIIERKLIKQRAGRNVEHLKRHQQYELSDSEIERRYNIVLEFFKSCYNFYDFT